MIWSIEVLTDGSALVAVQRIIEATEAAPMPDPPAWYTQRDGGPYESLGQLKTYWLDAMRTEPFMGKLTLFWHHHFATERSKYKVPYYAYHYYYVLRKHALGNFKTFVYEMGLAPAMLRYLDGDANRVGRPNENYARELLELFTMGSAGPDGSPNYTETDVGEIARALTGWRIADDHRAVFDEKRHDSGVKEILGQRGLFGYDAVIDILFEERAEEIAHFICRKLCCFFIQPVPDETFVSALAEEMVDHQFEMTPVLERLFTSAHFFDEAHRAARIKSPIELVVGWMRELGVRPEEAHYAYWRHVHYHLGRSNMSQILLEPPNVGGWPGYNPSETASQSGHYAWLDTIGARTTSRRGGFVVSPSV